ncbi:PQQ-binding-like beta-propeller repeat protein [Deinococcus puniceus]|uniref:Uncharacterized protein n=1 Tax=Deinococcus puniceus TaxID=1182568 RepID=A0A172T8X8_9DEIO|nr:hypothetical protein [Deinococcus puniceus]ANE43470.1 hypothetical protein SU48_06480 [Deinococcus puniceus]
MPQAQASAQGITFRALPGALTATRAGRFLWRKTGPLAHPTRLELLANPGKLLLLSEENSFIGSQIILSAYALQTGKLLWQTPILENYANASAGMRGSAGQTLVLSAVSGEPMTGKVQGIALETGNVRWTARQDLVGYTDIEALVIDLGTGAQPMNSAGLLPLNRITLATGKMASFTVKLPNRPNCGPMNYQGSIPSLTFAHKFLYALRQDSCGPFIARVDWHGGAAQTPLLYPDRRNAAPAVK